MWSVVMAGGKETFTFYFVPPVCQVPEYVLFLEMQQIAQEI